LIGSGNISPLTLDEFSQAVADRVPFVEPARVAKIVGQKFPGDPDVAKWLRIISIDEKFIYFVAFRNGKARGLYKLAKEKIINREKSELTPYPKRPDFIKPQVAKAAISKDGEPSRHAVRTFFGTEPQDTAPIALWDEMIKILLQSGALTGSHSLW
jgi:hypothetical protein